MKCIGLLAILACVPTAAVAATTPAPPGRADSAAGVAKAPAALDLRLASDGWGDASVKDASSVLKSAASQLLAHFPGAQLEPIRVHPSGGPITLFKRNSDGEVVVKLSTRDRLWAQYAFQFAHELCHVLCRCTPRDSGNKWFEESLCETASIYALRGMSRSWQTQPPYPNWKDYARHLSKYADERMADFALPQGMTLAQWYEQNAPVLRKDAVDRKKNGVVARALLPIFERTPAGWGAVWWLNERVTNTAQTFPEFLKAWHEAVPKEHRPFVREVAEQFGVKIAG